MAITREAIKPVIFIVVFCLILIGAFKYTEYKKDIAEDLIRKEAIEKENSEKRQSFSIILGAAELMFKEKVRLNSDSPDYYRILTEETSSYVVSEEWNALDLSEETSIKYLGQDIENILEKCKENTLCRADAEIFFTKLGRANEVHLNALSAWISYEVKVGNKLFDEARSQLSEAEEELGDIYTEYESFLSAEQKQDYFQLWSDSVDEIQGNVVQIYSYCESIDPVFHNYARYKTRCESQGDRNFITLDNAGGIYYDVPIKFTGKVSENTVKIVVIAKFNNREDNYTLQNYIAGETSFEYQAKEEWNNLGFGSNTYYFVAYFDDGKTQTTETTIGYYPFEGFE